MNETLREALLRIDSEEAKVWAALQQAVTGEDRVAVYRVLDGLSEAIRDGAALTSEAAPASGEGLPARIVVGKNGAYWRDYGTHYSMCPVSEDNDAVEVAAVYVRSRITEAEEWVREAAALASTATPPEPDLDAAMWRSDFVCYCRRQHDERCWDHPHRYDAPGVELGAIVCQPHGHAALSASPIPEAD